MESIDSILSYTVGNRTLGYVIKAFRDKQLVHTTFTSDQLKSHLRSEVDLTDPDTIESLSVWIFDLFARTRDLYENILGRYPEMYSGSH